MDHKIELILEKFPFLSYGVMGDDHYLGIVQNSDAQLLSMYCLDMIPTDEMKKDFLRCGEEWWWQSNRQIPINIFLKDRFKAYRPFLKHFNPKDFDLVSGHAPSLQDTIAKRTRKRQITLLRKID